MKSKFDAFIEKIPKNIHNNTRTFIGRNIAVFIPDKFVNDKKMILEDYHFVIFHSTPPSASIDSEKFQFKKGNLICMTPGTEITPGTINSPAPINYIAMNINRSFFEEISLGITGKEKAVFKRIDNVYSHKLLNFIEIFVEEIINYGDNCSIMLESIETQIATQILRDSCTESIIHKKAYKSDNDYIEQAIKFMQDYYSSNITISEICKAIYISPSHFQRIFKNHIGQTPYLYLIELRLNKSKEMLGNSHISIEEIARLCGFVSSGHFSTVFKREEGVSPSQYRKSII
ncbi:Helix-turn-helix domain-containing protein [Proteiniborus ethanoligenes]|uniref:Helix-turn-helix domain-containing protein n=1 Tax=Proteiniborus ethanoligenes TaxID=415015 RepID=A0A1H3QE53_9FIRM|nr:AraC family transcriptional regulator [Proteiniborus ethanoligenes]SDZ10999.1 Helix-turn-helix domain-containing protein [Proteiniborus ethanoligenes]